MDSPLLVQGYTQGLQWTHHSFVTLAFTEGGLVETVSSLLHRVGRDLAQGVHNLTLPVPRLGVLHSHTSSPSFDSQITSDIDLFRDLINFDSSRALHDKVNKYTANAEFADSPTQSNTMLDSLQGSIWCLCCTSAAHLSQSDHSDGKLEGGQRHAFCNNSCDATRVIVYKSHSSVDWG